MHNWYLNITKKVLENIHVTIIVLIVKCQLHSYDIVKVASAIDIWSTTALPSNEICSNIKGYILSWDFISPYIDHMIMKSIPS